jgi:hypothetical protein
MERERERGGGGRYRKREQRGRVGDINGWGYGR